MKIQIALLAAGLALAGLLASTQPARAATTGYVNVPLASGYNFLANPPNAGTNRIAALFPSPSPNSAVFF